MTIDEAIMILLKDDLNFNPVTDTLNRHMKAAVVRAEKEGPVFAPDGSQAKYLGVSVALPVTYKQIDQITKIRVKSSWMATPCAFCQRVGHSPFRCSLVETNLDRCMTATQIRLAGDLARGRASGR